MLNQNAWNNAALEMNIELGNARSGSIGHGG